MANKKRPPIGQGWAAQGLKRIGSGVARIAPAAIGTGTGFATLNPIAGLAAGTASAATRNALLPESAGGNPGMRSSLSEGLLGTPGREQQFQRYSPETQKAIQDILGSGLGMLQNRPELNFAPIAENARKNFQEKTIPSIAERFAGLDALGSSAFKNSLGQASADLESNLAAQQAQFDLSKYGQQNQLLSSLLGLGLTPQYENAYFPSQPGFLQGGAQSLASILPLLALLKK